MDNKTDGQNVGNLKGGLSVIQDFYLEFFGTLVPGVIAVTSVILLYYWRFMFYQGDMRICVQELGIRVVIPYHLLHNGRYSIQA